MGKTEISVRYVSHILSVQSKQKQNAYSIFSESSVECANVSFSHEYTEGESCRCLELVQSLQHKGAAAFQSVISCSNWHVYSYASVGVFL